MLIQAIGPANINTWHHLLRDDASPDLTVNLTACSFLEPYALVGLACLTESYVSAGRAVNFLGPTRPSTANYLDRMDLGGHLDRLGVRHNLPAVRRTSRPLDLLELQRFVDEDAADDLVALLDQRLAPTLRPGQSQAFLEALSEVAQNAPQHAGAECGFFAAQVYPADNQIAFAIGDAGCGIRASFDGTQYETRDDADAIRLATTRYVSRYEDQLRGQGLYFTVDRALSLGGLVRVTSGWASVIWTQGSRDGSSRALDQALGGTLVGVRLSCA